MNVSGIVMASLLLLGGATVFGVDTVDNEPKVDATGCFEVSVDSETAIESSEPEPNGPPEHARNPDCVPPSNAGPSNAPPPHSSEQM